MQGARLVLELGTRGDANVSAFVRITAYQNPDADGVSPQSPRSPESPRSPSGMSQEAPDLPAPLMRSGSSRDLGKERPRHDRRRRATMVRQLLVTRSIRGVDLDWQWQWRFDERFELPHGTTQLLLQLYVSSPLGSFECIGKAMLDVPTLQRLAELPAGEARDFSLAPREVDEELQLSGVATVTLARAGGAEAESLWSRRPAVGRLRLIVHQARGLAARRHCFVEASVEGASQKTAVAENSVQDPVFDHVMQFHIRDASSDLLLRVYETHAFRSDHCFAALRLPLSLLHKRAWLLDPRRDAFEEQLRGIHAAAGAAAPAADGLAACGRGAVRGWARLYAPVKATAHNRGGQYRAALPGAKHEGYGLPMVRLGFLKVSVELELYEGLLLAQLRPPLHRFAPEADAEHEEVEDVHLINQTAFKGAVKRLLRQAKANRHFLEALQRLFAWEDPLASLLALLLHAYATLSARPFELPLLLLLALAFLSHQAARASRLDPMRVYCAAAPEEPALNLNDKFRRLVRLAGAAQQKAARFASQLEKLGNVLNWSDPPLTTLALLAASIPAALLSLALYLVPLRPGLFALGAAPFLRPRGGGAQSVSAAAAGESSESDGASEAEDERRHWGRRRSSSGEGPLLLRTLSGEEQGPPSIERLKSCGLDVALRGHEMSGILYGYEWRGGALKAEDVAAVVAQWRERGAARGFEKRWCEAWADPARLRARGFRAGEESDEWLLRLERVKCEDVAVVRFEDPHAAAPPAGEDSDGPHEAAPAEPGPDDPHAAAPAAEGRPEAPPPAAPAADEDSDDPHADAAPPRRRRRGSRGSRGVLRRRRGGRGAEGERSSGRSLEGLFGVRLPFFRERRAAEKGPARKSRAPKGAGARLHVFALWLGDSRTCVLVGARRKSAMRAWQRALRRVGAGAGAAEGACRAESVEAAPARRAGRVGEGSPGGGGAEGEEGGERSRPGALPRGGGAPGERVGEGAGRARPRAPHHCGGGARGGA